MIDIIFLNNSLELLTPRLDYLWEVVDKFYILENTHYDSGHSKSFKFAEQSNQYKKYKSKIVYMQGSFDNTFCDIDFTVVNKSPFDQFNFIKNGLIASFNHVFLDLPPEEIVIIGDDNQIPNIDVLRTLCSDKPSTPWAYKLKQDALYYSLNLVSKKPVNGSIVASANYFIKNEIVSVLKGDYFIPAIEKGGWQLTWFNTIEEIQQTIIHSSAQENNTLRYTDPYRIVECINNGFSLDGEVLSPNYKEFPADFIKSFEKFTKPVVPFFERPYILLPELISVIIPSTRNLTHEFVVDLNNCADVGEIIIVGDSPTIDSDKIRVINFNFEVSPSINYGVSLSRYSNICVIAPNAVFDLKILKLAKSKLNTTEFISIEKPTNFPSGVACISITDSINSLMCNYCFMMKKEYFEPIPAGILSEIGYFWNAILMAEKFKNLLVISNAFSNGNRFPLDEFDNLLKLSQETLTNITSIKTRLL